MPGGAIAALGSAALGYAGARSQARAARRGAQAQVDAANAANEVQREIYYDQRGLLAPSIRSGADARARQMLMMGYTPDQVKAFLRETSSAIGSSESDLRSRFPDQYQSWQDAVRAAETDSISGNAARLRRQGFADWLGPQANTGGGTPSGGDDFSWVDGYDWRSSSPSYGFRFDEGQRALERSAAARGDLFSGGTGREITRYGQDYASNEFEQDWRRLGVLAGDGTQATGTTVQVAGAYGDNVSGNLIRAGQARASGYEQAGQAMGNFWQGAAGIPMYAQGQGWFGKWGKG